MMNAITTSTDKANVEVSARPDGTIVVKHTPKDFKANGAVELEFEQKRGDDGSHELIIAEKKKPAP